jgi:hypothetical protein
MNFKEFINEDKLEQRYSAGLAIIWQGKVLLAHTTGRKSSTGWGIPKGGIDKGESKINAVSYGVEEVLKWFSLVQDTWQKKTFKEGRLYRCDLHCGKN